MIYELIPGILTETTLAGLNIIFQEIKG
jgi:hypothetical protein